VKGLSRHFQRENGVLCQTLRSTYLHTVKATKYFYFMCFLVAKLGPFFLFSFIPLVAAACLHKVDKQRYTVGMYLCTYDPYNFELSF
jgi:hypothetical protein